MINFINRFKDCIGKYQHVRKAQAKYKLFLIIISNNKISNNKQAEYKLDGRRSPSKGKLNHRKKKGKKRKKKRERKQIVPDIHVIINPVCSRQFISALRRRKDSHKIKLI